MTAGRPARKKGATRIKTYVGTCRRCESHGVTIRSSYGICVDCYPDVQRLGHHKYYPSIWEHKQLESVGPRVRAAVWRNARKKLRDICGMTTLSEWLGVERLEVYVDDAPVWMTIAAVRVLGYIGVVTATRADDEFGHHPFDLERIRRLVEQARANG